jgi:hypothetical protein
LLLICEQLALGLGPLGDLNTQLFVHSRQICRPLLDAHLQVIACFLQLLSGTQALSDIVGNPFHGRHFARSVKHGSLRNLQAVDIAILMKNLNLVRRLLLALDTQLGVMHNLLVDAV